MKNINLEFKIQSLNDSNKFDIYNQNNIQSIEFNDDFGSVMLNNGTEIQFKSHKENVLKYTYIHYHNGDKIYIDHKTYEVFFIKTYDHQYWMKSNAINPRKRGNAPQKTIFRKEICVLHDCHDFNQGLNVSEFLDKIQVIVSELNTNKYQFSLKMLILLLMNIIQNYQYGKPVS